MAVKFGVALGLEVTVISTSESKRKTALAMGAHHFISSKDEKAMLVRHPRPNPKPQTLKGQIKNLKPL